MVQEIAKGNLQANSSLSSSISSINVLENEEDWVLVKIKNDSLVHLSSVVLVDLH